MSTGTAIEKTDDQARFAPARLPWHPAIEERFKELGVTKASWKVLAEAVFPAAKSADSIVMALSYCSARRLDPFKRPVHIVPMWDSQRREMVETVWPGISEIRTTAFRTGQYAGCDEVEFGPMITRKFAGKVGKRGQERDVEVEITFPEWGRMNVYRMLNGRSCKFVSPKVYWLESYGRQGASDVPNDMWAKRPGGQLEKCVEAAGLRKAFPEEVGNDYSAEEMAGQVLLSGSASVPQIEGPTPPPANDPAPKAVTKAAAPPAELRATEAASPGPAAPPVEDAEIVEPPSPAEGGGNNTPAQEDADKGEPFDGATWLEEATEVFATCKTAQDVDEAHDMFEETVEHELSKDQRYQYEKIHTDAMMRTKGPSIEQSTPAAPPADDEDDSFPGDDAIKATEKPKEPSPGAAYMDRIRQAIADPVRTAASLTGLWNATGDERKALERDGHLAKEDRMALREEIAARISAATTADGPSAPPAGPSAPPSDEDPAAAFDRDFRAKVADCSTVEDLNSLSTNTLKQRNAFGSMHPLYDGWREAVSHRRKQLSGIA